MRGFPPSAHESSCCFAQAAAATGGERGGVRPPEMGTREAEGLEVGA